MVYVCDNCHFSFSYPDQAEQCPDCGKRAVRPATEAEQQEFEALRQEREKGSL